MKALAGVLALAAVLGGWSSTASAGSCEGPACCYPVNTPAGSVSPCIGGDVVKIAHH